jgi:hypothetical protein
LKFKPERKRAAQTSGLKYPEPALLLLHIHIAPILTPFHAAHAPLLTPFAPTCAPFLTPFHADSLGLSI